MAPGLRRLYAPKPIEVVADEAGRPHAVAGIEVTAIREEWKVEDRWWAPGELRRDYFELALADGRVLVVFHCTVRGRWYRQRA